MSTGIKTGDTVKITTYTDAVDIATGEVTSDLKEGIVGTVIDREILLKIKVGEKIYLVSGENAKVELLATIKNMKDK